MNVQQRLNNYRENRNCTLLGVGPMSKNCIDASIELADQYKTPLMLIASRRQIDSEQFNGGYVEMDMIVPVKGYWIRANSLGSIILTGN